MSEEPLPLTIPSADQSTRTTIADFEQNGLRAWWASCSGSHGSSRSTGGSLERCICEFAKMSLSNKR
uniref:Uncharacterized protein n=1 Tax=Oryza sativa subsp. japonica TaxID=39947 RepID=Q6Z3L7_ORYSJ|nr:hypothetical protein [Oryza sativa Japonica Group]